MIEATFAIPGDVDSPTGGYAYARRLLALLPAQGVATRHMTLPASFPHPSAGDIAAASAALSLLPDRSVILFDGLAYGAMPIKLLRGIRQPIVALIHHPLSFEPELSDARRQALRAGEAAALAFATRVVVSSRTTRAVLSSEFGVAPDRIAVAEPGTIRVPRARGSGTDAPLILSVGAITPRKAYDVLVEALHRVADRRWKAAIVGSRTRDSAAATSLDARIASRALGHRIAITGEVEGDRLAELYDRAELFALPSLYEGYGMALAEAMARGLAIVATTGGAAAETVPAGAGLKVPPGDPAALAEALRRLLDDPPLRHATAEAAWHAGQALPDWERTAAIVAEAIRVAAR